MIRTRVCHDGSRGSASIAVALGTLMVTMIAVMPKLLSLPEYFAVHSAATEFVDNLKEAKRLAVGHDVDRRIRMTGERGYVREMRAGTGWLFEQAYVMPEGMGLFGPPTIEFWSRGNVGPVALYTVTGPNGVRQEILTRKNGIIVVQ
jgi:hypothetical protein